jgi:Brp/Blh family beta-carotene 15,15'-monooxygenase
MKRYSFGDILVVSLVLLQGLLTVLNRGAAEWSALGLIILAGIPHGSFDLRAAHRCWGQNLSRRILVIFSYISMGVLMSAVCLVWPRLGLTTFLLISALHFTEGERFNSSLTTALSMGIAAIVIPIGFHVSEAQPYVQFFFQEAMMTTLAPFLRLAAIAVTLLLGTCLMRDAMNGSRCEVVQRLLCLLSFILLPPLSGFCVWFIGRHSRQHLERSRRFISTGRLRDLPGDFIALSALAIVLILPLTFRFDVRDINQLFAASIIVIAGLTLPHMIVTHLSE